nr:plant UBX domain-containing protein 8 [Ipomoea batatas]
MARPNQEAVDTFMNITGVSQATAIQRLEEHAGDLNAAVNAHFSEPDRSIRHDATAVAPSEDDVMDIDDPIPIASHRPPFSHLPSTGNTNPFSLLDPNFTRSIFDSGLDFARTAPLVSHPREVREIPIEVKDGDGHSGHSGRAPTIEDVTDTEHAHGPETHGTVTIDDDDDEIPNVRSTQTFRHDIASDNIFGDVSTAIHRRPSAPEINILPDSNNDIEEEMIRAAIEASKWDAEMSNQKFDVHSDSRDAMSHQGRAPVEDDDIAHAVSLSLKTAEQEKAKHELERKETSGLEVHNLTAVDDPAKATSSNTRLELGSTSINDEAGDVEEQPLVGRRSKRASSSSIDIDRNEVNEVSPVSSPRRDDNLNNIQHNGADYPTDEWGGISSEEHDEAVMLEAAMFGGIPEGSGFRLPHVAHQFMQNGSDRSVGPYPWQMPRPPSPSLVAQRLLREQQDDEYLASLQADREKELKAKQEAEAALVEEKRKEEELLKKLEEEQEAERQLAAKEGSLPQEPTPDDENAVNLVVRMPDGSRRGRRFLKSDRLQCLFDFIDVGRVVKPGTYRLVRPYPRRAFSSGETSSTLNELGLTSKQEALFLELI